MKDRQVILVIDTAMHGCAVCVCDAGRDVLHQDYSDDARGQAQVLVPMVQGVLESAALSFEDLSDIIVCNGPGTFTGIRIGLSVAKTFGLVLDLPVHAITSLQALALAAVEKGVSQDMLAIVETRRQDFYVQAFDGCGNAIDEPQSLMDRDVQVGDCVLIGDAVARFDVDVAYKNCDITRIDVGVVARSFADGRACYSQNAEPIYLRAPDVSMPKNPPRKISS